MKIFVTVGCCFAALLCSADTLVTIDGKKYVDYQIMSPKHHGLEIMHSEGIATVPYDKLPVNLQQKYAEKAKQLKAAEKVRAQRYAEYQKKVERIKKHQREKQALEKKLKDFTFFIASGIKVTRVLDKNRIVAEVCTWDNEIVIADIDTRNLSDDTYLNYNYERIITKRVPKIMKNLSGGAVYVSTEGGFELKKVKEKTVRLFYVGTAKKYSNGNAVGQVWKFTVDEKKAIEFLMKNPKTSIPSSLNRLYF